MKIWLMNHYASSMFRDKAGRHYWFAKELQKEGYDVTIFCATTFLNSFEEISTGKSILRIKRKEGIPFVFVKTVASQQNGIDRIMNMCVFYKNLFPAMESIEVT